MKSTLNNGWGNPSSSIIPQYQDEKLIRISGTYVHNQVVMPFTLSRQKPGVSNCAFRGKIQVMSPETAYTLKAAKNRLVWN